MLAARKERLSSSNHQSVVTPHCGIGALPLRTCTFLAVLLVWMGASGCLAQKAYLDPKFRTSTYASVKPSDKPKPVVVEASFQTNGKDNPRVVPQLRAQVTKVLDTTKVFAVSEGNAGSGICRLSIVVNNYADMDAARAQGFTTGLTFGAAGTEVVDYYKMTVVYTPVVGSPVTKAYDHALHTTIGAHSAPAGLDPVDSKDAFGQIVQDMLLKFLCDMQKDGSL